ncbi:hypothetical protein H1C71_026938 [Ictidomys tridecemlineatus]|nr:hypothetical protein H1C71_026938 [Ictidomys tridecemlineatus]
MACRRSSRGDRTPRPPSSPSRGAHASCQLVRLQSNVFESKFARENGKTHLRNKSAPKKEERKKSAPVLSCVSIVLVRGRPRLVVMLQRSGAVHSPRSNVRLTLSRVHFSPGWSVKKKLGLLQNHRSLELEGSLKTNYSNTLLLS